MRFIMLLCIVLSTTTLIASPASEINPIMETLIAPIQQVRNCTSENAFQLIMEQGSKLATPTNISEDKTIKNSTDTPSSEDAPFIAMSLVSMLFSLLYFQKSLLL